MKHTMSRDEIAYEVERFSKKNYMLILLSLMAVFLYFIYVVNSLSTKVELVDKTLQENLNSIVAVTDSGSLIEVEKQELFSDMQENIITRALRNLIVSRAELTNGFKYTKFDSIVELVGRSDKLKYFLQFILLDDEKNLKDINVKNAQNGKLTSVVVLKEQAIGYFDAYVEALKQMLQKDTLPHFVNIKSARVKNFNPKGKSFTIDVAYEVVMQNFNGYNKDTSIKYETSEGHYVISAAGYFDIRTRTKYKLGSKTNGTNKIGLHFTSLKISKPSR